MPSPRTSQLDPTEPSGLVTIAVVPFDTLAEADVHAVLGAHETLAAHEPDITAVLAAHEIALISAEMIVLERATAGYQRALEHRRAGEEREAQRAALQAYSLSSWADQVGARVDALRHLPPCPSEPPVAACSDT